MTIPFGRRRLVFTMVVDERRVRAARPFDVLPGATDAELARLVRGGSGTIDIDRARWDGLTLLYGGHRRP